MNQRTSIKEQGFSFLEVLVATLLLSICVSGFTHLFFSSQKLMQYNNLHNHALQLHKNIHQLSVLHGKQSVYTRIQTTSNTNFDNTCGIYSASNACTKAQLLQANVQDVINKASNNNIAINIQNCSEQYQSTHNNKQIKTCVLYKYNNSNDTDCANNNIFSCVELGL